MRCPALCFLLIAFCFTGCGRTEDVRVIRLAHGMTPVHPVHKAMVFMAERVEELSEGRMRVEIFPSEQLGSERECIELLQIGGLDMTKASASPLEGFSDTYKIFGLPYIFDDDEHRFEVLEGEIGQEILDSSAVAYLQGVCYYDAGSRSFYTIDKPINSPADLAGLKIRTQESPVAIRLVQSLGGSATPIAWGELYSALQQGIVDGAENNPPSFYLSRHYEVCKFYSLDEHTAVPDVLLASTHFWATLSEEEKEIVTTAAWESAEYQKKLWREASEEAFKAVEEAGVTIIRPDKAPFAALSKPLYEDLAENPRLADLITRIRALETGK